MPRQQGDVVRAALEYAERGWYVFPLGPHSKKPLAGSRGLLDATTDPEKIRGWFQGHDNLNVGIATGPSGLVVIDVDGDQGVKSMFRWVSEHGPFARTIKQITGSGGYQLFYQCPTNVTVPIRAPWRKDYLGLDVRADGGYVAAPPSIHPNGREYAWDRRDHPAEIDVASLGTSEFSFIDSAIDGDPTGRDRSNGDSRDSSDSVSHGTQTFPDVIPHGQQDQAMIARAGQLRRMGMSEAEIEAALTVFVKEHCENAHIDWPEWERSIRSKARTAMKWEPDPTEMMRLRHEMKQGAETASTEPKGVVGGLDQLVEPYASWHASRDEVVPTLVEGILHSGSLAVMASAPKCGKTWLVIDLMLSIMSGEPFMLRYPVVEDGAVLYIATEGIKTDTDDRIRAMAKGKGVLADLEREGRFGLIWKKSMMLDDDDAGLMTFLQTDGGQWKLIVVDVLADAWTGNENDSAEFRKLLAGLRKVTETGATVLVVHHNVKPSSETAGRRAAFNMRGSGALYGSVDDGIYLEPTEDRTRSRVHLETRAGAPAQPEHWEFSWPETTITQDDTMTLTWHAGQEAVRDLGLDQTKVAEYLAEHPMSRVSQIASRTGLDPQAVSKALKGLQGAGAVMYEEVTETSQSGKKALIRHLYSMKPDLNDF